MALSTLFVQTTVSVKFAEEEVDSHLIKQRYLAEMVNHLSKGLLVTKKNAKLILEMLCTGQI